MLLHWGTATLSTVLLWLFLSAGLSLGLQIKASMGNRKWCKKNTDQVQWISEKTTAIIFGKYDDSKNSRSRLKQECLIKFGLASDKSSARIRLQFETFYISDCGVKLQINQSESSDFGPKSHNSEMVFLKCSNKKPPLLFAEPKNFILINLVKDKASIQGYNFRLNISLVEQLPETGLPLHSVIIAGFVCSLVVVLAVVILYKYAARLSYDWRGQRTEYAITRAIDLYNSQEPLEEPHLCLVEPGSQRTSLPQTGPRSAQTRGAMSEIAFVHSDGRIERFRMKDNQPNGVHENSSQENGRERSASSNGNLAAKLVRLPDKGKKPSGSTQVSSSASGERLAKPSGSTRGGGGRQVGASFAARQEASSALEGDAADTESLGGMEMPPSYEEALDMPAPSGASVEGACGGAEGGNSDTEELEMDYSNVGRVRDGIQEAGEEEETTPKPPPYPSNDSDVPLTLPQSLRDGREQFDYMNLNADTSPEEDGRGLEGAQLLPTASESVERTDNLNESPTDEGRSSSAQGGTDSSTSTKNLL